MVTRREPGYAIKPEEAYQPFFRCWVPFDIVEKAGDGLDNQGKIKGIATSEAEDADGEVIEQAGLDWEFFKSRGLLTYEHPVGALNIVGHPTGVKLTRVRGVPATEIEGVLYLDDPLGSKLWEKAQTMKKAGGARSLGFSIEGRVPKGARKGKRITAARVHSVAISPVPKNPHSWWEPIAASMGAALSLGVDPVSVLEMLARSEQVGYPAQGETAAGAGGLGKLVPQSMQGAGKRRRQLLSSKWLDDLDEADLAIATILKELPTANWSQGKAIYETIRRRIGSQGAKK